MISFVKQLASVGWWFFKTDGLFRLAALLYILAGGLSLFGGTLKAHGWPQAPTLFVWNFAILFSILFLAFTNRPSLTRKKIPVSLGSALLFCLAYIGTASLKLGQCPWQTLLAYDNWWMTVSLLSLLFGMALRFPNEPSPFDELAPFRLLRFMMEAGLITGATTLLSFGYTPFLSLFARGEMKPDWMSRDLFCFLLCTFCPLYTACRFMSPQGRNVKPGKVFSAALSLGWASLQMSLIVFTHAAIFDFWKQAPSSGSGTFGCLSLAWLTWWALAFVPKSVQAQDPLTNKIFKIFRAILPYIGLLPFLYMVLIHMQKWRMKFLLIDNDVWEILTVTAFFLSTLAWRKRRPISPKAIFQVFTLVALASCFWPPAVWNSSHAERVVFTRLQRLGAVDSQGKITRTDFNMNLSYDEQDSFMLAVMALVNDSQPSQRVRTLLQQADDNQQQRRLKAAKEKAKKEETREQSWPSEVRNASPRVQARFTDMSRVYRNFLAFCHITFPGETHALRFEQNQKLRLEGKHKEYIPYSLRTWLKKEREFEQSREEAITQSGFPGKCQGGGQQQNG